MALRLQQLTKALQALGRVLDDRGLRYEIVVVGGAAMTLHGATLRPTQDVDAIAIGDGESAPERVHTLPEPLAEAIADVASVMGLEDDWLNVAVGAFVPPLVLDDVLPNAASTVYGGLRVTVADRVALARLKLYAAVDEGAGSAHEADLRGLELDAAQVEDVVSWYRARFEGRIDHGLRGTIERVWGARHA